jgi:Tfp pilus assembly protein PilV
MMMKNKMRPASKNKARSGSALVEIMIATLLVGIAVSAIAGAMITTSMSSPRARSQTQAAVYADDVLEELKNFVTADQNPNSEAPGPGNSYLLSGDACGCYALQPGVHDVSSRLDATFRATYNASMTYTVADVNVNGQTLKTVTVRVNWRQPQ